MLEKHSEGRFNTALVFNPDGQIAARLPQDVSLAAHGNRNGRQEFCVFDLPGRGRIGLCVCYDQWFPEVARQLTWMGAEIIINPVMTTTSDRPLETGAQPGPRHRQPGLFRQRQRPGSGRQRRVDHR
jgi:predicted amidohydrolase